MRDGLKTKLCPRKAWGFTLLELMLAVTIFAILTTIAVPLYTAFSERGYRTEAMADLMTCSQAIERFSASRFTYVGVTVDGQPDGLLDTDICDPVSVRQERYAISVQTTASTFLLTAVPQGIMAGDGPLTIDQAGVRTWDVEGNGIDDPEDLDWVDD